MKKLVAYVTASYPDKNFTIELLESLSLAGADYIELGIPFSDPVADGPVIEQANMLALKSGFKIKDIFEISQKAKRESKLYWMGYLNPFYHRGMDFFIEEAKKGNVSGFIIPDMPYEESLAYKALFENSGVELVDFIAPTDTEDRVKMIANNGKGFIYLVAYAGITGAGKSEDLSALTASIRNATNREVFLGFGVNAENAKEKSRDVDGVIVGSAFVRLLTDERLTNSEKMTKITALAKEIKEKINS